MEWTAHCGCVLAIREPDGEPTELLRPCAYHAGAGASHEDVAGENRAMSLARKALEDTGVARDDIITEVVGDDRHGRAHGPNGEIAEVPKLSLDDYLAQHEGAASYARKG
jgi:hypothetical protein